MEELFRFMSVRPPDPEDPAAPRILTESSSSPFQQQLREALDADDSRAQIEDSAQAFATSDQFIASTAEGAAPMVGGLAHLYVDLMMQRPRDLDSLQELIQKNFHQNAEALIASNEFELLRRRLADSLIAITIAGRGRHSVHEELVAALRAYALIERVGSKDPTLAAPWAVDEALEQPVLLPPDLFPLPAWRPIQSTGRAETQAKQDGDDSIRGAAALRSALRELREVHTEDFATEEPAVAETLTRGQNAFEAESEGASAPAETSQESAQRQSVQDAHELPNAPPWMLSSQTIERLSAATQTVLHERGLSLTSTPVPEIAEVLADELVELESSASLPEIVTDRSAELSLELVEAIEPSAFFCAQQEGAFRAVGIADLMVVKQRLKRYESGELAHIENVLLGESKERTHRRAKKTETTYVKETETLEETEEDLKSAERFELKREAQKTIKEDHAFDASVTAKYGTETTNITASSKYGYKQSSEETNKNAVNYARDITARASSRVAERVREQRTRRLVQEIEETNVHKVDNATSGTGHVIGIYRYVDKVYEAQVYSWGKRLMFEFIVPEPAAFSIFAEKTKPVTLDGVTLTKPSPPQNKDGKSLRPKDITPSNYQSWVAQYGVTGVEVPPAYKQYVPYAFKTSGAPEGSKVTADSDAKELPLPKGYHAEAVWGRIETLDTTYGSQPAVKVIVGTLKFDNMNLSSRPFKAALSHHPTPKLPVIVTGLHFGLLSVALEVLCYRTPERYAQWQQKTYETIMTAYIKAKSEYEDSIAAGSISQGITISGSNPKLNRQHEKAELKKGAITLITRQSRPHLDFVGSINVIKATDEIKDKHKGHPELDFVEAGRQGPYIQFLEQAFEWEQISYVFYPYFWARKKRWADLHELEDTDPIHAEFQRAGAARVLAPVRPGYEASLLYFLETQCIWQGTGPPSVASKQYVSLVKSIKEKHGYYFTDRPGTIAVKQGAKQVIGSGTDFAEDDVDREIMISAKRYRILRVESRTKLTLYRPYKGKTDKDLRYAIGLKLIGLPWEVDVATTLVLLQEKAELPTWD